MSRPERGPTTAGLGLRFCPNHPDEPLILKQTPSALFWRCEHPSGCAHTEDAIKNGNGIVAVNGRASRSGGFLGGKKGPKDAGVDSSVERTLERTFKNRARRREQAQAPTAGAAPESVSRD